MPSSNYFQGTAESPFHISIGAVLENNKGEIACHYFKEFHHRSMGDFKDFYLLMRETIESNETLEGCLSRGLMEEFGAAGKLISYIGSIVSRFPHKDVEIEKTTLYFHCELIAFDPANRKTDDPESSSQIIWLPKEDLVEKMQEQAQRLNRQDLDESKVLLGLK